jgi:hypothetical protein
LTTWTHGQVAMSIITHYHCAPQTPGAQGVETAHDEAECALASALWYIGVLNGLRPALRVEARAVRLVK